MQGLIIANATVTLILVGLILTIQWLHYPLFTMVGRADFVAYEAAHEQRVTVLVAPLMVIELLLAAALSVFTPAAIPHWTAFAGLALVAVIWISTFALQVPLHATLGRGWDADAHARLVGSNWIRTCAWILRGSLAVGWLFLMRS